MPRSSGRNQLPYHEILPNLVSATMRAQAELQSACETAIDIDIFPDGRINRHFAWLGWTYGEAHNRHLIEGEDASSLRTDAIRATSILRKEYPGLSSLLDRQTSLPWTAEGEVDQRSAVHARDTLIQKEPTRISKLIKAAARLTLPSGSPSAPRIRPVSIASPLSIVYDFLTIPDMPGSRAYALLSLRTYLFELFEIVPNGYEDSQSETRVTAFSVRDVEDARSRIWTSIRARHHSRGRDKFASQGRHPVDSFLRQFLAMQGLLWFSFRHRSDCVKYCAAATLNVGASLRVERSPYLEKLPELGEIVNEVWGIPVPIRGGDTVFRGGLKFSSQQGLVVAIHGGPGTGKTSLALAIAAYLAPMQIRALYLTSEEDDESLVARLETLIPSEYQRVSFFPRDVTEWLTIGPSQPDMESATSVITELVGALNHLSEDLSTRSPDTGVPKPCRAVIVLDGLHEIFLAEDVKLNNKAKITLRQFITKCRELRALVVLTTSAEWAGDSRIDYLVDIAIDLKLQGNEYTSTKPQRYLSLTKARHQLCAIGMHGLAISGEKGLRFSPQTSYRLDERSIWKSSLPDTDAFKLALRTTISVYDEYTLNYDGPRRPIKPSQFYLNANGIDLYRSSNIFISGQGSGGKAALALKLAIAPTYRTGENAGWLIENISERILVVSFLYPKDYYDDILLRLLSHRAPETRIEITDFRPRISVIHLYPGHYGPDELFNRIEWALEAAELNGDPFTCTVIDGLHNVSIQFPSIQKHGLFWPQLYSALRSRSMTTISTYTALVMPHASNERGFALDDQEADPLRHALVQKMDFHIEVDPVDRTQVLSRLQEVGSGRRKVAPRLLEVKVLSAINQAIPLESIYWSREGLVFCGLGKALDSVEVLGRDTDRLQYVLPLPSVRG